MLSRAVPGFTLIAAALLTSHSAPTVAPRVELVAVPDGGIQPQAAIDSRGTIHLIYFKGEAARGDLFYARLPAGATAFTQPRRVTNEPGSAIAAGTVRGGQLALGRNGWVHVAWNGQKAMQYARLAPGAAAFEPQRAIGTQSRHLDGGGAIAAARDGRVQIVWHAAGETDGETSRRIYIATSADDGATFGAEIPVSTGGGNCGCCQIEAQLDARQRLHLLTRSAGDMIHRDTVWLTVDGTRGRPPVTLHAWQIKACPMTTFAMASIGTAIVAAWETEQQIYSATLVPDRGTASPPAAMNGIGIRKHPAVAVNRAGDRLFAWTEGTAWARGGTVGWELRNGSGTTLDAGRDAGTVPVWGLVTAVAKPDGSFVIVH